MDYIPSAAIALIFGLVLGYFYSKSKYQKSSIESGAKLEQLAEVKAKLDELQVERNELSAKIAAVMAEKEVSKSALEERIKEQKEFIEQAQKNLTDQFKLISNKQLEENTEKFVLNSAQKIDVILAPLSKGIDEFKKEFKDTYSKEEKERFSLQKEINRIVEMNTAMSRTTENLTKALKGDRKLQGNWGEMILESLLENAGLRKGEQYVTQENYTTEDGKRQLPDVIIKLPESRHIIVDSKVSLVSYEKYYSEELEDAKILHARSFVESVKNHIKILNTKSYQDNQNLESLDFVIMFMPIEGTFQLAYQQDPNIFSYAWTNRVVLTSPATLFPILRTISSIWKVESQNRNTQEIIKTATSLYDKFLTLALSIEKIGEHIEKSNDAYESALSQLRDGKGNAISIVKKLESYGIEKKKSGKKVAEFMQDVFDDEDAPDSTVSELTLVDKKAS